jgi:hypothetical protein
MTVRRLQPAKLETQRPSPSRIARGARGRNNCVGVRSYEIDVGDRAGTRDRGQGGGGAFL